jgi:hypothetical protein
MNPICERCQGEILPGQNVEILGRTVAELMELRIIVSDSLLMVHADPDQCQPESCESGGHPPRAGILDTAWAWRRPRFDVSWRCLDRAHRQRRESPSPRSRALSSSCCRSQRNGVTA